MRLIRFKLILVALVFATAAKAQVPNFGTTVGDQKLYGYSALKYRLMSMHGKLTQLYSMVSESISNLVQI